MKKRGKHDSPIFHTLRLSHCPYQQNNEEQFHADMDKHFYMPLTLLRCITVSWQYRNVEFAHISRQSALLFLTDTLNLRDSSVSRIMR